MERNVGLFNESFPPVMDGVAVCVENYARWIQEKVGGVSVVTPKSLIMRPFRFLSGIRT